MNIAEVYDLIEGNADRGTAICLYGQDSPSNRRVSGDALFTMTSTVKKRMLTLFFEPDESGAVITAGMVLDCLDRALRGGCKGKWKCQIAITGFDGEARGYLSDTMWSHMVVEEYGCFSLDHPVGLGVLSRTWRDDLIDTLAGPDSGPI